MSNSRYKLFVVPKNYSGERLQNFLKNYLGENYSGKRIKQLIDSYGCKVNGRVELFASYKVVAGDKVQLNLEKMDLKPRESLKIVYEDEEILICDKPSDSVCDANEFAKVLHKKLYLVHRLDKDTTGVILLAKNQSMQKKLEELFKKREIKKVYHAIVEGEVSQPLFKVENTLGKLSEYEGQSIWGEVVDGAYALTHFELLKKAKHHSFIKCLPFTGRTHQIRVHLAQKHLPILGDDHYARDKNFRYSAPRPLLHAYSLSFTHPTKKTSVHAVATYPKDFKQALHEIFQDG